MQPVIVNVWDTACAHLGDSFGPVHKPELFIWDRTRTRGHWNLYTNECALSGAIRRPALAWLMECPEVAQRLYPGLYERIVEVEQSFEMIFTMSPELLERNPARYRRCVFGGMWIRQPRLYPKSRLCSMLCSRKDWTSGHRLRHSVVPRVEGWADVFGYYARIHDKEEALCEYRFSIVIENSEYPNYFTEKLIDCFATGTVPIYWGCPNIEDYFDSAGILRFRTTQELAGIRRRLSPELYDSLMPAVRENFERCLQYACPEDWLARMYLIGE